MIEKRLDVRYVSEHWYVVKGDEHIKLNSYWEALDYAQQFKCNLKVMSEQFYKQCYEERTSNEHVS